MTIYFLDSSAIGKRYMTEVGSDTVLLAAAVAEGFVTDNPLVHP